MRMANENSCYQFKGHITEHKIRIISIKMSHSHSYTLLLTPVEKLELSKYKNARLSNLPAPEK